MSVHNFGVSHNPNDAGAFPLNNSTPPAKSEESHSVLCSCDSLRGVDGRMGERAPPDHMVHQAGTGGMD